MAERTTTPAHGGNGEDRRDADINPNPSPQDYQKAEKDLVSAIALFKEMHPRMLSLKQDRLTALMNLELSRQTREQAASLQAIIYTASERLKKGTDPMGEEDAFMLQGYQKSLLVLHEQIQILMALLGPLLRRLELDDLKTKQKILKAKQALDKMDTDM